MARIDYNRVAADYARGRGLTEDGLAAWRAALQPHLDQLDLPVVDIGSGTGQFAALFPRWFGVEVVGVEPSEEMRAEAIAHTRDRRVTYLGAEAEHLPLADGSCGAAWLSTVIHHIPNLEAAAREVRRVVVREGQCSSGAHSPTTDESPSSSLPEAAGGSKVPSIDQVERSLAPQGSGEESNRCAGERGEPDRVSGSVALRADTTLRACRRAFAAGLARLDGAIRGG